MKYATSTAFRTALDHGVELEGRRAVSAQFEPMAEKVKEYCALIRDRLDQLSFEEKREVPEVLQAEFTLDKDGQLRILLVLPATPDGTYVQHNDTNVRHASIHAARSYNRGRDSESDCPSAVTAGLTI